MLKNVLGCYFFFYMFDIHIYDEFQTKTYREIFFNTIKCKYISLNVGGAYIKRRWTCVFVLIVKLSTV